MKKKLFNAGMLTMALTFMIMVSACATVNKYEATVDDTLDKSQTAQVEFWAKLGYASSAFFVDTYNGIDIRKEWYKKGRIAPTGKDIDTDKRAFSLFGEPYKEPESVTVTLPAGSAEFTTTLVVGLLTGQQTITYYTIPDVQFAFNFEAGKKYSVCLRFEPKDKNFLRNIDYLVSIRVYEGIYRQLDVVKHKKYLLDDFMLFDTAELRE